MIPHSPYLSDAACVARVAAYAARLGAGLRDGSTLDEVTEADYATQFLALRTAAAGVPPEDLVRRVALGPVPTGPRWSREALGRMTYDWRRARAATLRPPRSPSDPEPVLRGVR